MNSAYATRYADIRYTQGGLDNVELARTYFIHGAKLAAATGGGGSERALWGVLLVSVPRTHACLMCDVCSRATG
jgi:hypothetical protein